MAMYTPVAVPGGFRYMVEKMDPADYLNSSYYERWLFARTQGLIEAGVITAEELQEKIAHFAENQDEQPPTAHSDERVQKALRAMYKQQTPDPPQDTPPQFEVGQTVWAKNLHPIGHTRLPRYCRGKQGVIDHLYGYWRVDDTPPEGEDHAIEPLYRIKFTAQELWGSEAEENQLLFIDMFESYLTGENHGT